MSEQFSGLLLLVTSLGGIGAFVWKIYDLITYYIYKNYVISLHINTKDSIYDWIVLWLKNHGPINDSNHWTVKTNNESGKYNYRSLVSESEVDKTKKSKFVWKPRPGIFYFRHYKTGQFMRLRIRKTETHNDQFWSSDDSGVESKDWETLTLETFGTSTKLIDDLISEAHAEHLKQVEGKTVVYRFENDYPKCWKSSGAPKSKRLWNTIFTQDNIKEDLIDDIKKFQRSSEYYQKRGIPYRRGYLLYGPPGTGKSSLIYALAGELNMSLCVMCLSDKYITDEDFLRRMENTPSNTILLIEDIDVALPSEKRQRYIETQKQRTGDEDKKRKMEYSGQLTLSGVLNGIDGVTTPSGQILFMTTNHRDNLDQALIRPGRIDRQYCLKNCNETQIKAMCRNFYENAEEKDIDEMVKLFKTIKLKQSSNSAGEMGISPAEFENFLVQYKDGLSTAIQNVSKLERSVDSELKHMFTDKTIVYRYSDRKWKPCKPQDKRPWNTVVTQNNIKDDIFSDIKDFENERNMYRSLGIPYRRGYLLYGPPGTGKTSLVHSLSGRLNYGICLLNLADMTDNGLLQCLSEVPNKCIVLIEEVDIAVPSKQRLKDIEDNSGKKSSLTFGGVLNAIDGIASEDSQIIIMTTNHREDLDHAFIRPGRVDREFYLGNCDLAQVQGMFKNFFPNITVSDLDKISETFESLSGEISPAKLQGHLLRFKRSLKEAVEEFPKLDEASEELPDTPISNDSGCLISEDKLSDALTEMNDKNEPNPNDSNE